MSFCPSCVAYCLSAGRLINYFRKYLRSGKLFKYCELFFEVGFDIYEGYVHCLCHVFSSMAKLLNGIIFQISTITLSKVIKLFFSHLMPNPLYDLFPRRTFFDCLLLINACPELR